MTPRDNPTARDEYRNCPFEYCNAEIKPHLVPPPPASLGGGQSRMMVPIHDIDSELFNGRCPASNMYIGFFPGDSLPAETAQALSHRAAVYGRDIPGMIEELNNKEKVELTGPLAEDQQLRGPHRLGREPDDPDHEDWQIGGREDEESGHVLPEAQPIPDGVGGYPHGRNGMSISELQGMLQGANVSIGETLGMIVQIKESFRELSTPVDKAKTLVGGALDQANSPTLQASLSHLGSAEQEVGNILALIEGLENHLRESHMKNEQYIGILNQ